MEYSLEKSIWNQDDCEQMDWHNASIYGMIIEQHPDTFSSNLLFDIDYIFQWVHPIPPDEFTFWVAPCTLIFKDVYDLILNIDYRGSALGKFKIDDLYLVSKIELSNNVFVYEWDIILQEGFIHLKSFGLEQIVRKYPMHIRGQVLDIEQREGISFGKTPCN